MKGEQADYIIPLKKAFLFPKLKRIRKALTQIKKFVWKHARSKKVLVSNEINELLHANSKNIPHRIPATLFRDGDKVIVFKQKGRGIGEYLKKKEAVKKKDKKDKEAKKEAKEEKKEEAEKGEEHKRKLEEKKAKEESAKASEIKRRTGK